MENRSALRHQTTGLAMVILSQAKVVTCEVADISPKGARLTFRRPVVLPREFDIVIASTERRLSVRRIWQHDLIAGVQFGHRAD